MPNFSPKKPLKVAGVGDRMLYGSIDALLFILVWNIVVSYTKVRPPFLVMQRYRASDYEAYLNVMFWMTLVLFVISFCGHWLVGGSIGKLTRDYRTLRIDGSRMTALDAALRSAAMFLIALLILAPGPLIAYVFGEGSEISSFAALFLGVVVWIVAAISPVGSPAPGADESEMPPTLIETALGLMTVKVERVR